MGQGSRKLSSLSVSMDARGGISRTLLRTPLPGEGPLLCGFLEPRAWTESFARGSADAAGLEFPGEMQKCSEEFFSSWVCYCSSLNSEGESLSYKLRVFYSSPQTRIDTARAGNTICYF